MSRNSTMYQRWMPTREEIAEAKQSGKLAAECFDRITHAISIGTVEAYEALPGRCRKEFSLKSFQRNVARRTK